MTEKVSPELEALLRILRNQQTIMLGLVSLCKPLSGTYEHILDSHNKTDALIVKLDPEYAK